MTINTQNYNGTDNDLARKYAELHGQSIRNKGERLITYLKEPETPLVKTVATPIIASTLAGAGTGLAIGGAVGGPAGLTVGGVTGGILGFGIGCEISRRLNTKNYERWQKQYGSDKSLVDFLSDDKRREVREKLMCPLSHHPILDPVVSPEGIVYQRDAILEHIKQNGEIDPFTHKPLKAKDLRTEHTMLAKNQREFKKVLSESSIASSLPSYAKEGFEAIQKDLESQAKNILEGKQQELMKQ